MLALIPMRFDLRIRAQILHFFRRPRTESVVAGPTGLENPIDYQAVARWFAHSVVAPTGSLIDAAMVALGPIREANSEIPALPLYPRGSERQQAGKGFRVSRMAHQTRQ